VEHQRDSPKVNVFCAISSQKVYSPFFFAEETVTGKTYLDMLQLWLMPQLQNISTFIFQQDGSPAHFHCEVRQYLNTMLKGQWIGHASGNDQLLMLWPPSSVTQPPVNFSLGICQRPGIRPNIATWPLWPTGTDHCSSEEFRCTHVDACVAKTWISYRCMPCHPWCTHRTSLVVKKTFSVFLWLWTIPLR
jgi:hypothetical protein